MLAAGEEKAALIQQYHTVQPYFVETGAGRCGESGEILSMYMDWWRLPCVFWLAAHGPERDDPTPIKAELAAIFYRPWGHVILIDDARLFGDFTHWPPLE